MYVHQARSHPQIGKLLLDCKYPNKCFTFKKCLKFYNRYKQSFKHIYFILTILWTIYWFKSNISVNRLVYDHVINLSFIFQKLLAMCFTDMSWYLFNKLFFICLLCSQYIKVIFMLTDRCLPYPWKQSKLSASFHGDLNCILTDKMRGFRPNNFLKSLI